MRREHPEGERLSAFLDDELSERQALRITRHLARCQRCLGELEDIRTARSALRELPNLEPPATLWSDVVAEAALGDLGSRRSLRSAMAAVAGAGILLAAAYLLAGEEPGSVQSPSDLLVVDTDGGGGPATIPVEVDR